MGQDLRTEVSGARAQLGPSNATARHGMTALHGVHHMHVNCLGGCSELADAHKCLSRHIHISSEPSTQGREPQKGLWFVGYFEMTEADLAVDSNQDPLKSAVLTNCYHRTGSKQPKQQLFSYHHFVP